MKPVDFHGQPVVGALDDRRFFLPGQQCILDPGMDEIPIVNQRGSDILVVRPDPNIDYKIVIVKPDSTIDYKILKVMPEGGNYEIVIEDIPMIEEIEEFLLKQEVSSKREQGDPLGIPIE